MLKRTMRLGLDRRIRALEASLRARPELGAKVVERANLPEREKQILLSAVRDRIVFVSNAESERLNSALGSLPALERALIEKVTERAVIMTVNVSEADARL